MGYKKLNIDLCSFSEDFQVSRDVITAMVALVNSICYSAVVLNSAEEHFVQELAGAKPESSLKQGL